MIHDVGEVPIDGELCCMADMANIMLSVAYQNVVL